MEVISMTKKEIRNKFKISHSTLQRRLKKLENQVDISKRIFCNQELSLILQSI